MFIRRIPLLAVPAAALALAAAPALGATAPTSVPPFPTSPAALLQMQSADFLQAQAIAAQIAADSLKQQAERWRILTTTQTSVFAIQQSVLGGGRSAPAPRPTSVTPPPPPPPATPTVGAPPTATPTIGGAPAPVTTTVTPTIRP